MAVGTFVLSGSVTQLVADGVDSGTELDLAALTGMTLSLTCNVPASLMLPVEGGITLVAPRVVTVLSSGQISENGTDPGVKLLANDPALDIDGPIQWRIKFSKVSVGGRSVTPRSFSFDAPAPGVTRTLNQITPVPAVTLYAGGPKGDRGGADGDLLVTEVAEQVAEAIGTAISDVRFLGFYEDSTGDVGEFDTSTSGATYVTTQTTTLAELVKVDGGTGFNIIITGDTLTSGTSAGYKQWDNGAGKALTFSQADLQYVDTGTTSGASFCLATSENILSFGDGAPVLNVPIHIVVAQTYFSVGEFTDGVFTEHAYIPFSAGSVGYNRFHVEWGVNYDTGDLYLRDPAGVVSKVNHVSFKREARYSFFELFLNASTTDDRMFIYDVSASTIPLSSPMAATTPLRGLVNDYATQNNAYKNKVDKVQTAFIAYGTDGGGSPATWAVTDAAQAYSIPRRDGSGFIPGVDATIHGATAKAAPVSADELAVLDSSASYAMRRTTIAQLTTVLMAALGAGAPATLDTIDEIAAALGDDPNAISSILTSLSNKITKSGLPTVLYGNDGGAVPTTWAVSNNNAAFSVPYRDANGNLFADAFVPGATSTATAGGTTALTVDSTEVQVFTGSSAHTVTLPTTGVVAGQRYMIHNQSTGTVTVNSSSGSGIASLVSGQGVVVTALFATPTLASHWATFAQSPYVARGTAVGGTLAIRDSQANLVANNFLANATTTASSASTLTLTVASAGTQIITGSANQTITLPTTSVPAGLSYLVVCDGTTSITVNASNGSPTAIFGASVGNAVLFVAKIATPTLPTDWAKYSLDGLTRTSSPNTNTVAVRDANARLLAAGFIPTIISTATSGGSNTVGGSGGAAQTQVFTGTTTHTGLMASTGIVAGQQFTVLNQSTGAVTINSSAGNLIKVLPGGTSTELTALQATPTAANHWYATSSSGTVTNRVVTVTAGATPTSNTDTADVLLITGLTVDITNMSTNMTGTPNPEDALRFAITGTASRAITWGTKFESGGATLPTTTTGTQRLDVGFFWNSATSKWRCMAVASA